MMAWGTCFKLEEGGTKYDNSAVFFHVKINEQTPNGYMVTKIYSH